MSYLRQSDLTTMAHFAGLDSDSHESGVILEHPPAPSEEPDEPLSTWLPKSIRIDANTPPRLAADGLRDIYNYEQIVELLVCLLSPTAHTETKP